MRIKLASSLQSGNALRAALGVLGAPSFPFWVNGIATDSREVQTGDLFVALRGKRVNGADFTVEAAKNGAAAVLTDEASLISPLPIWRVENVASALLRAAALHRTACKAFVVAVSGSSGKTTVKEALAAMLAERGSVAHSKGNFNSSVGLPLSVLSFEKTDFWVVELGISHVGEMAPMATAVAPDLAVLTNVGSAHLGHYPSRESLLFEKAQLCCGLSSRGLALVPAALPVAVFPCGGERLRRFGRGGDFSLENIVMHKDHVQGDLHGPHLVITNLKWPVTGRIGADALLTVLAAGVLSGLSVQQLRQGLERASLTLPRMHIFTVGDLQIIDDSYNASPEAMLGALEVLSLRAAGGFSAAVLGDMLELGREEATLHRAVGEALPHFGISALLTYGTRARWIAAGARAAGMRADAIQCFEAEQRDALTKAVCALPQGTVLFKGSAQNRLSDVVREVIKQRER